MTKVRNYLQHVLNPLHIYCRLRSCGLDTKTALRISTVFERFFYRPSWLSKNIDN
ncbi:hypothetical protein [Desulfovibrio litoralis]|uniref:Uncharacterized protein n=1 Tax=Desulfovibrio litoralis DSM 11393 TaxID=1121455 RepID=A0A1M7S907_9BACT|nr:hypothetical protein [Desulfovibrio litoralis]SHN54971.1 hypothetical protein SAMN02745728_00612 [Desulfovibrio litoralis DSM 11393]